MAVTCLQSKVRNISGNPRHYSYLPPHGRTLDDGQEFLTDGDILDWLSRHNRGRHFKAFYDDLHPADGSPARLALVYLPQPHIFDLTLDKTSIIGIDNGTVTVSDPCWGAYSSSM